MADKIIELGLFGPEQPIGLIDQLLALFCDERFAASHSRAREFQRRLDGCRRKLAETSDRQTFSRHAAECLAICEQQFVRSRTHLIEREAEFAQMIQFLREAISRLSGESSAFTAQVRQSSERMDAIHEIGDIRELRKRISSEVSQLKRILEEKQRQDEASFARLSKRVEILQERLESTREEAALDGLTRIANRRTFDLSLGERLSSRTSGSKPCVLALFDIDNFKQINDAHGHQVGDRVLLCAAQALSKGLGAENFLARFGGEEFAALLDDCGAEAAHSRIAEILARISAATYQYEIAGDMAAVSFTLSCGVAESAADDTAESLVRRADQALYEAKNTGKNRAVIATSKKSGRLWRTLQPFVPFRAG